jgi:catechol 2,3-dioxygenase-like lactoylglutathione lyase family enzyme
MTILHLDHVNLVVRDLAAMVAFYERTLGFVVTKRVTIRGEWIERVVNLPGVEADVVYLDLATGPRIELIQYRSPAAIESPAQGSPHTLGLRHIAFKVEGIDTLVERLRATGIRFFGDVQRVPDEQVTYAGGVRKRLVYFHDPEGNLLELCEYSAGT